VGFELAEGSIIDGCTASGNRGSGISLLRDTVARDNTCDSNGAAGIYAAGTDNRIEGNNVTDNSAESM
jgi:parallel beta-helix repeat protein